ncbi:MAG: hypothetical protein IT457_19125 [Planctomycetes bacterium]|nr:hypothetical protein [Planctomycetota bacterium]
MSAARQQRARSVAELAQLLDVSIRSVRRWRHAGMPTEKDGTWRVDRVRAWRSEETSRNRERGGLAAQGITSPGGRGPRRADEVDELREARAELIRLGCRGRELELRERRAGLVPRGAVAALLHARRDWFRARLLRVCAEMTPRLAALDDPIRVQAELEAALLDVLEEAHSHVPSSARDSAASPPVPE